MDAMKDRLQTIAGWIAIALAALLISVSCLSGQEAQPWDDTEPVKHYAGYVLQDTLGVTIRTEGHMIIDSRDGTAAIIVMGGVQGEPEPRQRRMVSGLFSMDVSYDNEYLICVIAKEHDNWPDFMLARQYCLVWDEVADTATLPSGVALPRCKVEYHGVEAGEPRRGT